MASEGTGASITFATTSVTLDVTSIQSQGITWAALDTTYLGTTTAKTYKRGDLYDPGTITISFLADPDDFNELLASSATETITITYPSGATEASSGFISSIDPATAEVDNIVSGSLTIQRTGAITFTDAA